ncbi:hypothetical protein SAMN06296036_107255 [Pseudobacteriovorax antillogorgiicola]|uniref:Uncharacterized protein n=1 Tax=Pseudobacteriovorax antillogorgiicola TaxID=1513793 RepID=A0A1Y6BRA7_9BACT|nr:hypothetical protein EDD56_10717 [Pseudobacteriovorax antillogorgiicola]SMF22961.1 hypothetical protein SAMN06296036_107255 [Pseudobacteriovorax antillogorgiicola]
MIPLGSIGPVKIGMKESEVQQVIGRPTFVDGSRKEYLSGYFVNYDSDNRVEYIEVWDSDGFGIDFNGINPLKVDPRDAVKHIESFDKYDEDDPELGDSYIFKSIQVSLWRGSTFKDSDEKIEKEFESLGIGKQGYYR